MPVTCQHVTDYQRDGAVLIKHALNIERLARLQEGIEEAVRTYGIRSTQVQGLNGEGHTLVCDYVSHRTPSLRQFIKDGFLGGIAAKLMQTASVQLILDQVFYKTRGPIVPTPWHQDTPFLRVRGDELIRLWLPCDSSPKELTVQVVRGSHRWNVVYNTSGNDSQANLTMKDGVAAGRGVGDPWLPVAPDIRRHRESFDILSWDVEPGDVLAFQGNVLHGTDGHPGHDRARRAFAVLLGGPELRYHAAHGKSFPSPGRVEGSQSRDDMRSGEPIGTLVDAFPLCWPVC